MFLLSCVYFFRLMNSVMRMESWTKQFLLSLTTTYLEYSHSISDFSSLRKRFNKNVRK